MNFSITNLKPAVSKAWLLGVAGLMWSGVGVMLCRLAWVWLYPVPGLWEAIYGGCGLVGALAVYYFGFSKIAKKNIRRLCLYPDKACFFAFQAWKSYLIIVVMIILGITLRHSPVQKYYLAVVYITIGGALFLSSFHYYGCLMRLVMDKKPCR